MNRGVGGLADVSGWLLVPAVRGRAAWRLRRSAAFNGLCVYAFELCRRSSRPLASLAIARSLALVTAPHAEEPISSFGSQQDAFLMDRRRIYPRHSQSGSSILSSLSPLVLWISPLSNGLGRRVYAVGGNEKQHD